MCRNNWRQGVREIDELWDIGNTQARDDEVLTEGCGSEEEEERHVSDAEEVGTDNQLIIIWVKSGLGVQVRSLMYVFEISCDLRWDLDRMDSCWLCLGDHCWPAHISSVKL